jgi:hypothetical protein
MLSNEFNKNHPNTSRRILIVDDSPADVDLLIMNLTRGGYQFTW